MKWMLFILVFITGSGLAQKCSFDFHMDLKEGDSIIGVNDFGNETSLKFSGADSIDVYLHVKQSKKGKMKVGSIEAVIAYSEGEISEWNRVKIDSLSLLLENNWLDNIYLKTALTEWTFGADLSDKDYPQLLMYKMPSLHSDKVRLDGTKLWKAVEGKTLFNYRIEVIECSGRWVKLNLITKNGELEGWMPWYNLCHRTLTLCHHIPEDGVD